MSDPTPYIATIKNLYSAPVEMKRTLSGTFGDGNVAFSLPKEGECIHGSSKFICVFCQKWYGLKPTIISSMPSCSVKTGQPSNPPLSLNATSGKHSASLTQSLAGLVSSSPNATKSDGLHSQPGQK